MIGMSSCVCKVGVVGEKGPRVEGVEGSRVKDEERRTQKIFT
jgi:hypothetical protein